MKFNEDDMKFYAALGRDDQFWDYEFMDDNPNNSYLITYDDLEDKWTGIKEVLDREEFIYVGDLSAEQVEFCRNLIPETSLPTGDE